MTIHEGGQEWAELGPLGSWPLPEHSNTDQMSPFAGTVRKASGLFPRAAVGRAHRVAYTTEFHSLEILEAGNPRSLSLQSLLPPFYPSPPKYY